MSINKNQVSKSKKKIILNLIENGLKFENDFFKIYLLDSNNNKVNLYITNIPKKCINKSFLRNLFKRRIKHIFHKSIKKNLQKKQVLIMPTQKINELNSYKSLEKNLLQLFSQYRSKK